MKVVIIGGGLSGLIAGKRLAESGMEVKVLEARERLGGLATSFEIDGFNIPIFYHHIFSHDAETLKIVKEVGLDKNLVKKRIKMGMYFDGKKYAISYLSAPFWDFLSLRDKIKFGLLALHTKIKKRWDDLEGQNAEEWLDKKVGENVRRKIFENLMKEKYGLPLSQLSASELAERLGEEEAKGYFYYPREGLEEMVLRLKKGIESRGGEVHTNACVAKLEIQGNEAKKITYLENGKTLTEQADVVINTAPVPVFLKFSKGLPADYASKLSKIKYCKNICVDVGYSERLSDFYWLNCFGEAFGGIIEHTNLADIYPFKMAWLFKYAPSQQVWNLSDEDVAKLFLQNAKKLFPRLKERWVKVFRSEYASPLYDIDYKKYMPDYTTPIKNLFFSGVALTYPKIRTMNSAFVSGMKTAELVKKLIGS